MENREIKVIKLSPDKEAEIITMEDTLQNWQKAVGGYIEVIYPYADPVAIVCNEESKLIAGMKMTRSLRTEDGKRYDILMGDCFIVGLINPETGEDDGEFYSLSDELIEKYMILFGEPEVELIIGNLLG